MTKDFEVTIKVRNNRLLAKMRESGFPTASALARADCGLCLASIHQILKMKQPGRAVLNGEWRPAVQKLADFLGCMPEDIVPEAVRENPLAKNTSKFTLDGSDVQDLVESLRTVALPADARLDRQEMMARVREALSTLTPREERVLRLRFGFDGEEHTLEAAGDQLGGISRTQVARIEDKALRKLKGRRRLGPLREALPEWELPKPKRKPKPAPNGSVNVVIPPSR